MTSLPLGKISLSSDFLFSPPAGSEERTEERGFFFFFPFPLCCLFSLLTPHLLYRWAESTRPWLFLNVSLGHKDFLGLQLSIPPHTAWR